MCNSWQHCFEVRKREQNASCSRWYACIARIAQLRAVGLQLITLLACLRCCKMRTWGRPTAKRDSETYTVFSFRPGQSSKRQPGGLSLASPKGVLRQPQQCAKSELPTLEHVYTFFWGGPTPLAVRWHVCLAFHLVCRPSFRGGHGLTAVWDARSLVKPLLQPGGEGAAERSSTTEGRRHTPQAKRQTLRKLLILGTSRAARRVSESPLTSHHGGEKRHAPFPVAPFH